MNKAYLVLQNGSVYEGQSFGAKAETVGEVVFNTGMVGYHSTLTDKCYQGQIVVQTFPIIGNYGIINENFEGDRAIPSAYVVKEYCYEPSNFRCEGKIEDYLIAQGVPGICGIDTRALTKEIRENGVMNAKLVYTKEAAEAAVKDVNGDLKNFKITGAVKRTGAKENIVISASGDVVGRAAVIDFGAKKSVIKALSERGVEVMLCKPDVTADEIIKSGAKAVLLTEGPGDPLENVQAVETVKALLAQGITVYGLGLGHQILALANGFKTGKMKFGHRGASQPVKDIVTGRVYITTQNHGYEVLADSVDENVGTVRFININDNTCEGIEYKNSDAKSLQFEPDTFGGVLDTAWFYDEFAKKVGGN